MQSTYHSLFQLHLKHDYFSDGRCRALEIVPTDSSKEVLNALVLRTVTRDYGVEVFYADRQGKVARLLQEEEVVCLSFWLRVIDPLFHNYTAGLDDKRSLFYATNLSDEGNLTWELSEEAKLPVKEVSFSLPNVQDSEDVTLIDALGNNLNTKNDFLWHQNEDKLAVNLNGLPAAHYRINLGDTTEDLLLTNDGYQAEDIGLISIFMGNLGETGKRIISDGAVEPVKYTLACTARATYWRYNIINTAMKEESPVYRIFGGEVSGVNFPIPEETIIKVLPNGQTATLLISDRVIPLRQRPELRLTLEVEQEGQRYTMGLPGANPGAINRAPPSHSTEELLSEIYVYL